MVAAQAAKKKAEETYAILKMMDGDVRHCRGVAQKKAKKEAAALANNT